MSRLQGLITKVTIKADAQGNPPSSIEVLRTGDWHTPWHGDFEITMADLHEFAANFAKGVGLVEGDARAPINYAHESWDKAAGWMTSLSVDEARMALVASCEWTTDGAQSLKDGQWAYISPEFNPRGCPWEDPEGGSDPDEIPVFINNVLSGAALTNIPLFKKLKPIMASRVPSKKKADVTSGDGNKSKSKEGEPMALELSVVRAKEVADLTDEEKTFLSEHKTDLTDDERTKFELVDDAAQAQADKEAADKAAADQAAKDKADADAKAAEEAEKKEASARGVKISADRLAKLEADAQAGREAKKELERTKADAVVSASVKAGQIKSGDKDKWVDQLLASKDRPALEALIAGLPKVEIHADELGDRGTDKQTGAKDELNAKVAQQIKASAADGKTISYYQARADILAADSALAARVKEEEK